MPQIEFGRLYRLLDEYPNLYADLSAGFTAPGCSRAHARARGSPAMADPRVTIAVQKTCWPDHAQPTTNTIDHSLHNAMNVYKDQTTGRRGLGANEAIQHCPALRHRLPCGNRP